MTDQYNAHPFQHQLQNGIFDMLMALIQEYQREGVTNEAAVGMACDWMISLATTIKGKYQEIAAEDYEKQNQIFSPREK